MSEAKLNLRQVLLTAIITCIFTIVAGVVTYLFTTKQPALSYSVSSGPTLSVKGVHKRIFSIEVINSGRKEVSNASATIQIRNGQIEEVAYDASPGLILTEDQQVTSYLLKADTLNPNEKFSISIFATIPASEFTPMIAVRGKGVTGSPKELVKKDEKSIIFLLVGSIAAMLGMLTSISPLMRKMLGYSPVPTIAKAFIRSGSTIGPFDRNELVAYILGLCSLKELSRMIRFAPSEISFRGSADYIVSEALSADENNKIKFIKALKCMLLIKRINQESVDVIAAALKKLAGTDMDEIKSFRKEATDEDMEPAKLRNEIAKIAEATEV